MTPPRRTLRAPSLTRLKFIRKVRRAAPPHIALGYFDATETCKNQCADSPLRPGGASERQFALSRPPRLVSRAHFLTEPIARRPSNASAAPAEQRVPSLQGCGGMEHSRWKGRRQATEGPLAEAFEWALETMEDRSKGRWKFIGTLYRCASGASTRVPFPCSRSFRP